MLIIPAIGVVVWGELSTYAGSLFNVWDKLLHATAYFGMTAIASVAIGGGRRSIWVALGFALFGALLEIAQGFVGRDMSFHDEVANIVGATAGLIAAYIYLELASRLDRLLGYGFPVRQNRVPLERS